jgi:heme-degrading monooxygenase HmoA
MAMMTVVTHVKLKEGQGPTWDAAMRERLAAVKEQPGFVAVQLCIPSDAINERVIIGTWESRADWAAWHETEAFRQSRARLEAAQTKKQREWWHEVVLAEHR